MDNLQKLTRPLDSDDIELRVGHFIGTNGFVELLAYKTARTDCARLDEVFPFAWRNKFERDSKGRLFCTIGIWFETIGWVERSDTGIESFSDGEKGEASDAFKRAGFKWGIGAELYSLPKVKINLKSDEFKFDEKKNKVYQTFNLKLNEWTVKNDNGRIIITDETNFTRFDSGKKYNPKPTENPQEEMPPKTTPESKTQKPDADNKGKEEKPFKSLKDIEIEKAMKVKGLDGQGLCNLLNIHFKKKYSNLTALEKDSLLNLIKKEGEL